MQLSFSSLLFAIACLSLHAAGKPNVVVIVADDLGYADVRFNPYHPKEVATPHLDALAKESVIFRQGYVSGHVCSPTRTGLMTGRYQQRLGLYTAGEAGSGVPMSEKLFPQYLKPAGYATGQLGKWHLGPTLEWSPALRGFDEVFGFLGRGAHDYFKLNDPDDPIYRGTNVVKESGYLTDRLGEEAVSFVQRHKAEPFFLYLAFNAVHAPLQAPADEIAKFNTGNADRNTLLAMGKRMDDAIGQLVGTLKKEKVWDNTLLFFISDNGGPLAQSANNAPLRGGKHQDYEGGIRVPFLVCWPAQLKGGVECQVPVISLDILPTALAAAGVPAPTDKPLDGINLLPIARGEVKSLPRDFFWCAGGQEPWWAIRSGDWKLVAEKGRPALFDLSTDVSEKNDLAAKMPDKVAELTKLHDAWLAPMPMPINGEAKRWGQEAPPGAKTKKPKNERKKNQPAAAPVASKAPAMTAATGPKAIHESFAAVPAKPWRAARAPWEAHGGALWVTAPANDEQGALLRGPCEFTSGTVEYEFNLRGPTRHALRFRSPDSDTLFRVDITPAELVVIKMTGEKHGTLNTTPLKLADGDWQKLQLTCQGETLSLALGAANVQIKDEVFGRAKAEVNFLVNGGTAGFRKFSMEPSVTK